MAKQPQLNGQAPELLRVAFGSFQLDHTDEVHMLLRPSGSSVTNTSR